MDALYKSAKDLLAEISSVGNYIVLASRKTKKHLDIL